MLHRPLSILIVVCSGVALACSSGKTPVDGGGPDIAVVGGTTGADAVVNRDPLDGGGVSGVDARGEDVGVASVGDTGRDSGMGGSVGGSTGTTGTGGRTSGASAGAAGTRTGGQTPVGVGGSEGGAGGRNTGGAGGRATGGTSGQRTSGTAGTAGGAMGGQSTGVTGAGGGPKILWTDSIQSKPSPWGLDGFGVEHPIGTNVTPSDANGANFSVVPDPLGGTGLAIRHFATFDTGGSRSQGGLYSDVNTVFGKQAKSPEGVWIAQEWYFPEAIGAKGDAYCWINLWDFHSVDGTRGARWHTSPGLMLAQDGTMKVRFEWGGTAYNINKMSGWSAVAMPVGRWFDVEMHYVWADTPTGTVTLWIDGQLALEQTGVQTKDSAHQIVETYLKFYGSNQGRGPWTPTPSLKYTRNIRIAGERIGR